MGRKRLYSDEERIQRAAASKERWRKNNLGKVKKSQQDWQMRTGWKRNKRPGCHNNQKDQRRYNLTKCYGPTAIDEWTTRIIEQVGLCKNCGGQGLKGRWPGLHIDHDHKTGKIRGLLCQDCNVGLGMFKEDPTLLQAAINYLKDNS